MEIIFFCLVAIARLAQKISQKKSSVLINDSVTFFKYGAYYFALAFIISLITLFIEGLHGFNWQTLVFSVLQSLAFAINLYACIEALKGASLVLSQMFAMGALIIPCIAGIFMFNEPMSWLQWIAVALFLISAYFLTTKDKAEDDKKITLRTFLMLLLIFFSEGAMCLIQDAFTEFTPNHNTSLFSSITFLINTFTMLFCLIFISTKNKQNLLKSTESNGEEKQKTQFLSKTLLISGLLLSVSLVVMNYVATTLTTLLPSYIVFPVLSAITLFITYIVGVLFYKEKATIKTILSLLLGLVAIIGLSVLTPEFLTTVL